MDFSCAQAGPHIKAAAAANSAITDTLENSTHRLIKPISLVKSETLPLVQRAVKARPNTRLNALTAIDRVMRISPKARAKLNSPLLVSKAIAVVMVRV